MFTKEQLISQARENVKHYASMVECLSKEGENCKGVLEMIELDLELARITLAALEAKPVKNDWISCGERMPERFKTVLVCTRHGEIWTGIYDSYWDFYCDDRLVKDVTHWMPIPQELPGESNEACYKLVPAK